MAVKKVAPVKKVKSAEDNSYSELDAYCIWLDEFYRAMKRAGLPGDVAMGLLADKDSYPDWIKYGKSVDTLVAKHLEDESDD